jgi:DNA-binding LytR/AlgR family response regulator
VKVKIKLDEQCEETTIVIVTKTMTDEINELVSRLQMTQNQHSDLFVGFKDGNASVVHVQKIVRIYATNQKVYFVTEHGEYMARLRLYEFEERLSQRTFVRISNSEIINLQKVRDFDLSFSGSICVRFIDGSTTYVSRRYVKKIKSVLGM